MNTFAVKIKIRKIMKKYLFLSLLLIGAFISCSDDSMDMEMEMEEEMNQSVNITGQLVGTYSGTNTFGEGGSFITEDDRNATITMVSDSVIRINISTLFGDNTMAEGKLSSETEFMVQDASVLGSMPYNGTGVLSGDSLNISLANGNESYTYVGVK